MVYILFNPVDLQLLQEKVTIFFGDRKHELIPYPNNPLPKISGDDLIVTFLSDKLLKKILPTAAKENFEVGILPHPEAEFAINGFGIAEDIKTAFKEIFDSEEGQVLDVLFCNGEPVLQSVKVGHVFALGHERKSKGFFSEGFLFVKNAVKISSLSHIPFVLKIKDESPIKTSALGIVVVEHSLSSVLSRKIVGDSTPNDQAFEVVIIAPESLVEFLWFLLNSLLPGRKRIEKLPPFIGRLKVEDLLISTSSEVEFTIDGEKKKASSMQFEVGVEQFFLRQNGRFGSGNFKKKKKSSKSNGLLKKEIKTEKLPKGEKREMLVKKRLPILPKATNEEYKGLLKPLKKNSQPDSTFFAMMILSTLIAAFGLFSNSSSVIIGAMILAPIITPVVAFSMGLVRYNSKLIRNSFITIFLGTFFSILFAALLTSFIPLVELTPEIGARLSPNLLDLGVAVASGIAAAYAYSKEEIAKSLAGVAIAVALVPPLAVAGIGIGWHNWTIFSGALLLYFTNLAGIVLFAGLTFLLFGFAPFKRAKKGLIYSLLTLLIISIPLSLSFHSILRESDLEKRLKGITYNNIVLKEAEVQLNDPVEVFVRVASSKPISEKDIVEFRRRIEEQVGEPVQLEITTTYEFIPVVSERGGENSR